MEEQNSSLNGQREPLWLTLKEQKMTIAIDKDGNVIELYGLPTAQGGGSTFTPTVYALNDTPDGNINLDTVEVASSASGTVTVQVCTLDVPSGWYIVTYKGLLDVPASNGGDKMTVFMQAYNTNTQEAKIQAMSGYITANTKNTYYLATTIMKIEENENIRIGLQQFTNATRKNHTRGLVAMRIGDI